jgi:hypothetical protein
LEVEGEQTTTSVIVYCQVMVQAGKFRQILFWRTVRRTVWQKSFGKKISGPRLWQNALCNVSVKLDVAKIPQASPQANGSGENSGF